jgi:hypothetical protein
MREDLQRRYADRFTPLLNKRIAARPADIARPDGENRPT